MIHENSTAAHHGLRFSGKLQPMENRILDALFMLPDSTRECLTVDTGMKLSSVCGRVRSLLDKGAIYESGSVVHPVTGKKNATLRIKYADSK